jgi:hypothetical protein
VAQRRKSSRRFESVEPDVIEVLAEFERWYRETHPNPFWKLFETYMPETPVVDF